MSGAVSRLVNLVRRDGILVAIAKIVRYLSWQIPAQFRRWQIGRLPSAEERFTKIYEVNFWAAKESASGPGSSLDDTRELRRQLPTIFARFSIGSVFDAPCGDFNWMKAVMADATVRYVGADIVRPMIDENNKRYADDKTRFLHLDITRDAFPKADLWICRDCFYHLSIDDISHALQAFVASGIPYLLASSTKNPREPFNQDIKSGDFRRTDLMAAPFLLPKDVLFRLDDNPASDMCLWSREQVMGSPFLAPTARPLMSLRTMTPGRP
jgi:SAM-dependent methyltransferase